LYLNLYYIYAALRNIGHLETSSETIVRCFQEETSAAEIRLAAMDLTSRLLVCSSNSGSASSSRSSLLSVMSDQEEDSELRIGAYLASMSCPNQELVDGIKEILQNEEVNQGEKQTLQHLLNIVLYYIYIKYIIKYNLL